MRRITYSCGVREDEVSLIHQIERECFPPKSRWCKAVFKQVVDENEIWVARLADLPVGYLVGWKQSKTGSYIAGVAIRKGFQGRGIGSKLIGMAEDFYRQRGYRQVKLDVDVSNPAQSLYFRLGYRVCRFSKKLGLLNMAKPLR